MASARYVALLRGINVGGKNPVKMADLRAALERAGFRDVETYIQSGNVAFAARGADPARLARRVARVVGGLVPEPIPVVVIAGATLAGVVAEAPRGFGAAPDRYRYDVLFVTDATTPAEVLRALHPKDGVDDARAGAHAVYFRRLVARATESRLARIVASPVYKAVTIRNWNTTRKLLAMATRDGA